MVITYKTITSIFIMPTLKIAREFLHENDFINAYLGDLDKEDFHEENAIFLLFKPKSLKNFATFLDIEYQNNKQIIDDYDHEDGYVVIVYLLDEQWDKDFKLIKQGKYSKVSEDFKELFPEQVQILNKKDKPWKRSLQWMIFDKDPKLIQYIENIIDSDMISTNDLEVWPCFNEKNEVLDIDKIIENEKFKNSNK